MPRYYFHVHDDEDAPDLDGMDLPDIGTARSAALAGVREMMCDQLRKGRLPLHHWVEVEDEAGEPVLFLSFADAIRIEP